MIENKTVLAIIPARGGSKGLPGKNKKILAGKPLVAWPIESAVGCCFIDKVLVTTDDQEIQEIAKAHGAAAPFLRPAKFSSDSAKSIDAILHAIDWLEAKNEKFDYTVLLEPTSPLTTAEDISQALQRLVASREIADSIVGISNVEGTHPEYDVRLSKNELIQPFQAPNFQSLKRRQELEELFFLEGSLYISDTEVLRRERNFYHARTLGFKVPRWKSIEIDEIIDFLFVETIIKNMHLFDVKENKSAK
ncbi:acylneuraminate cytidylyltransferase family protein [Undibacterium sp. Jales W-56]|uniref:acylneuraminate cytidylyltransferase family protein n=1 Tax=Undibacterium sp. Jales W-56 TaxID=2897325 RepID=UPI0021CFF78C|nr:acylneuraminate cytidylyltransferase family protein [Undibacterium sp. Jales W-56]MCU6433898.1 acylneuraminate cytidylyltransferase family protein [Undibacterium sp. Jales W-56]